VRVLLDEFERPPLVALVRSLLEDSRRAVAAGYPADDAETIAGQAVSRASREWGTGPRPVINATGVILHTNLGRAPLSRAAMDAAVAVAAYSNLEFDVDSGRRGSRQQHVSSILTALTGAQAAHVVTNNAAAVLLALRGVATRREVIVSRGQAVEIGGGFRVPLIMQQSGARLVEVGTTNRTRIGDYADAITDRTGAILHVHSSNFRIVGFSETVELAELASLAHRAGILLIDDNGSGALLDTARFGLAHEPTPQESLAAGADIVTFSADKLLGGPQAGILVGRDELIAKISKLPLSRALRIDKMALASLHATLQAYLRGQAGEQLPVWQMIAMTPAELESRARAWQRRAAYHGISVELRPGESTVGGGSLPGETLPTTLLVLPPAVTAESLRSHMPSVIGRTHDRRVMLDLRTVRPEQEEVVLGALQEAMQRVDHTKNRMIDSATR
jgi:L-seryl-tRNA(Ser) seleniumtransferase